MNGFIERCSTGKCNMEGEMTGNRGKFRDVFRNLREWTVCSR
nr:MAG TPA: hypothetical protein [Caudoviricetes sp.]